MNYQSIFNDEEETSLTKMRPFLPKLYDVKEEDGEWKVCIENLLYGREFGSFVDIKLGTSTLTQGKGNVKKVIREKVDMDFTTSYNMGLTICGMSLKNPKTGKDRDGGQVDKSKAPKDFSETLDYLEHFFRHGNGHDMEAIDFVIRECKKM